MFKDLLAHCVSTTDGAIAALVMGFDGIPVDSFVRGGETFEVETVGMEFSVVLREIKRAASMLNAGTTQEVSIVAEKLTTVVRLVNDEYFIAMVLRPTGNHGKARFVLRMETPKLEQELSM